MASAKHLRLVDGGRERLVVSNLDPAPVAKRVREYLTLTNTPPRFFRRGRTVVRLHRIGDGVELAFEVLDEKRWQYVVQEAFLCVRSRNETFVSVPCPTALANHLSCSEHEGFPYVDSFAYAPFFARDGTLCATPGYHPSAKRYLVDRGGLCASLREHPIPTSPSDADVVAARGVLEDLYVDFPFRDTGDDTGAASRAHAFAATFHDFVRDLIDGMTPMHYFRAPVPQTGKSKLARISAAIALGSLPPVMTLRGGRDDDAEIAKHIIAALHSGTSTILFDNVRSRVDSATLEAALTSDPFSGRLLGTNEIPTLPNRVRYALTGNNCELSADLVRRSILITLDARCENPTARPESKFVHCDIEGYALAQRPHVVRAILTLVQRWIAAGQPQPTQIPDRSTHAAWRRVIGGIFETCGITGLLGNVAELEAGADTDSLLWQAFFRAWRAVLSDEGVLASDERLVPLAIEAGVVTPDKSGEVAATGKRLGYALRRKRDAIHAGLRLTAEPNRKNVLVWTLTPTEAVTGN